MDLCGNLSILRFISIWHLIVAKYLRRLRDLHPAHYQCPTYAAILPRQRKHDKRPECLNSLTSERQKID